MVNRLWQYHFGQGIVATPNDFGAQGEPATHPELLDWLAVEFMDSGLEPEGDAPADGHIGHISADSALVDPKNEMHAKAAAADPGNKLLWHARRQRLTGEALRDAMLFLPGDLNLRMFGPAHSRNCPTASAIMPGSRTRKPRTATAGRSTCWRKRNLRLPLFDAFDLPDMHNSCPRRSTTTTGPAGAADAQQRIRARRSRHWAGRLLAIIE